MSDHGESVFSMTLQPEGVAGSLKFQILDKLKYHDFFIGVNILLSEFKTRFQVSISKKHE